MDQTADQARTGGADAVSVDDEGPPDAVDRSLIRERLSRTALQRLRDNQRAAQRIARLRAASRRTR